MKFPMVSFELPGWIEAFFDTTGEYFSLVEERMDLVIALSRLNVENKTGGPFGAAIFEQNYNASQLADQ